MKKTSTGHRPKLRLHRETIRKISLQEALPVVGGGSGTNTATTVRGCDCLTDQCSVAYCLTNNTVCC